MTPYMPWNPLPTNLNIVHHPLPKAKNDLDPHERTLQAVFYEDLIQQWETAHNNGIIIYTDASINAIHHKSAFAIVPYFNGQYQEQLATSYQVAYGNSIMSLELAAIHKALDYVQNHHYLHDHILICSDALSALQAMQQSPILDNKFLIQSIFTILNWFDDQNTTVTIMWTPSHIGIKGNELADTYANLLSSSTTSQIEINAEAIGVPLSISTIHGQISQYFINVGIATDMGRLLGHDYPSATKKKLPKFREIVTFNIQQRIQFLRIKFSTDHYCPYHHRTICSYCADPFSTKHYLLKCPASYFYRQELFQLLAIEDYALDDQDKIRKILAATDFDPSPMQELLTHFPPIWECPEGHKQIYNTPDFDNRDAITLPPM